MLKNTEISTKDNEESILEKIEELKIQQELSTSSDFKEEIEQDLKKLEETLNKQEKTFRKKEVSQTFSKRAQRRKDDRRAKRRLEKIKQANSLWLVDKGDYLKKYYRGDISPALKKVSNRKVRYYKGKLTSPGDYRRVYDFWWNLI